MTKENKKIILIIALGTIVIGAISTFGVYFIFGESSRLLFYDSAGGAVRRYLFIASDNFI
jgi:flagellar basal body-associated protein FliL